VGESGGGGGGRDLLSVAQICIMGTTGTNLPTISVESVCFPYLLLMSLEIFLQ
jgi:hypothetical protein